MTAIAVLLLTACTQKTAMNPTAADESMAKRPEVTTTAAPTEEPEEDNSNKESSNGAMLRDGSYQFKLASLKNSGREGWAYIKDDGGRVKVTLNMLESRTATATAQPAHIHVGMCPEPGGVKYVLGNVVNGKSETLLPPGITLASIMTLAEGTDGLSINVHASTTDTKTYVACGDLKFKKGQAMNDGKASGSPKPSHTGKASPSTTVRASQTPTVRP